MNFSDGMEFDTSGQYRLTHRSDGWYVVGKGLLMSVSTPEEGQKVISEMQSIDRLKSSKG